jgi:hypothetical protein
MLFQLGVKQNKASLHMVTNTYYTAQSKNDTEDLQTLITVEFSENIDSEKMSEKNQEDG